MCVSIEMETSHMQGMETGKQAQDPKEEPIELQQDPKE